MKTLACICAWLVAAGPARSAVDLWDLPPISYSDTAAIDPIAKLAAGLADGTRKIQGETPLDRLRFVLDALEIPEESQILVFSKTSKQNPLIRPNNPRCLFFNENHYVGYVPGGDIEVIAADPQLGSVYYLIEAEKPEHPHGISRDTSQCLSCHGTARTESIPGVLVRSVFPDQDGHPLLALGTYLTDHTSPIPERWGGYYVTGRSSLPHLGNQTYQESDGRKAPQKSPELSTLAGRIDVSRYPRQTSDIVALMVLEHQCRVHNAIVSAGMNYRRIHWLQKSLDPAAEPDSGAAGRHADESARRIVDLMLFANEAPLGDDGIEGDPAFQDAFIKRFPKSQSGRSLADFHLNRRIFKHRCSYMIYSRPFQTLPPRVKSAVLRQLHETLRTPPSPDNYPQISASERRKIDLILNDTLPDWSSVR